MFQGLKCQFTPRKYQQEVLQLVAQKRGTGQRDFHIVAPPGSGKTILGLQLVIDNARPALVLAPNAGIQSQWVDKLQFFVPANTGLDRGALVSAEPGLPRPIMALTYQGLTTRSREERAADSPAQVRWLRQLVEDGEVGNEEEALAYVARLHDANPDAYAHQIAVHERALLMELENVEETLTYLHPNARALIDGLVERDTGTIVLDECHHLTGYWARVAQAIVQRLRDPVVIGLTATPPDEAHEEGEVRNDYLKLVGDIDYQVPTPAVIREGHLAPFQDLVHFCRPSHEELSFVASADAEITQLWNDLEGPPNRPAEWIQGELETRATPTGRQQDWQTYLQRRRTFCAACRDYLTEISLPVPDEIRNVIAGRELSPGEGRMIILERFVNRHLMLSEASDDHRLAERVRRGARLAGYQITSRGLRACESPVSRVMARSRAKAEALAPILTAEKRHLGDALRAVVITDFERSSATRSAEAGELMNEEAGGAIEAFRVLTSNDEVDELDPILVTGQTVLVDDELLDRFTEATGAWIGSRGLSVELSVREAEGFYEIVGKGSDWTTRNYVLMMTEFLTSGLTRCLVGTRGLLGEGWDCPKVNCLIDLTTAATSMTVRQLRGRSIRIDPDCPRKVANNWDVVCMAPEFQRGLSDYLRFAKKHAQYHSLTDDGQIEKGVHHVHAALKGAKPEDVALATHVFNEEMIRRSGNRETVYDQWAVGTPYDDQEAATTQIRTSGGPPLCLVPGESPLMSGDEVIGQISKALLESLVETGHMQSPKAQLVIKSRSGGYCRAFLEGATSDEMAVFATALAEVFSPLEQQRYMAPRHMPIRTHTWLSRLLPEWIGRYLRKQGCRLEMYHPVPDVLGSSRERADVFQTQWNRHVSPGDVLYTRSGKGKQILQDHRGQTGGFAAEQFDVWR